MYVQFSTVSTFFFFQAEDGIRDHCVTGVQTCALPICIPRPSHRNPGDRERTQRLLLDLNQRETGRHRLRIAPRPGERDRDRKSVVEGKSVDLGGRRIIKKKKKKKRKRKTTTYYTTKQQ